MQLLSTKHLVRRVRLTPKLRKERSKEVVIRPYDSLRKVRRGLLDLHGIRASVSTIRQDLHACGKVAKKRRRGPGLSPQQREKRVAFCKQWKETRVNLLFSDEAYITTNAASHGWQWCDADELPEVLQHDQGAEKVLVWGCVGLGYKKLIVLTTKGALTKKRYQTEILPLVKSDLQRLTKRPNTLFEQDGARAHCQSAAWLKKRGVASLTNWPAKSCDLAVIETCWSWLKSKVSAEAPFGIEELIAFVKQKWEEIPQSSIDRLIKTFPSRVDDCIKAKGNIIKPRNHLKKH